MYLCIVFTLHLAQIYWSNRNDWHLVIPLRYSNRSKSLVRRLFWIVPSIPSILTFLLFWHGSVQSVHAFETEGRLVLYSWKGLDQEFAYPFDGYQMEVTFLARDHDTNQALPILGARIISSTNNMNFFLRYDRATEQHNATTGETSTSRTMELALGRNGFTKAFVVTLFIVNWALTAVCAYITISALVGVTLSESIVVLPVSVILTIPALRALWIDAPGFGEDPNFNFMTHCH